jgi:hypothetical protein
MEYNSALSLSLRGRDCSLRNLDYGFLHACHSCDYGDYGLRKADCIFDQEDKIPGQLEDSPRLCDNSFRLSRYRLRHKDYSLRLFDYSLNRFDCSRRRSDYSLNRFDWSQRRFKWSRNGSDCSQNRLDWSRSHSYNGICRSDHSPCLFGSGPWR